MADRQRVRMDSCLAEAIASKSAALLNSVTNCKLIVTIRAVERDVWLPMETTIACVFSSLL